MTRKIHGPALIGFSDFFTHEVIGAPVKGQPPKVTPYPKAKHNPAIEKHGKVLTAARKTAASAAHKVMAAAALLRKPAAKPVHVGAALSSVMTPKQKAAVQKQNAAATAAQHATKALAARVSRAHASVSNLAKAIIAQKRIATHLRPPKGAPKPPRPTFAKGAARALAHPVAHAAAHPLAAARKLVHVGALIDDEQLGAEINAALDEYYTAVGADPDPNNPGYLTDGTPDPAYASGGDAGAGDAGLTGALTDDPSDTGAPLPPAPDVSYQEQDAQAAGGILYRGEKGYPDGFCGSLGLMTKSTDSYTIGSTPGIDGTDHFGYVYGKFHDTEVPNGIPFGDDLRSGGWNHVRGRHSGAGDYWNPVDYPEAVASNAKNSPQGKPYGPLVGNPGMPDFAHMRVDYGGNMFWYPQEAPDWVTFPLKQAAALTAQAAAKAKADADAAAAAAAAKAQADQQAAQAAQDAQNALAESQAASQAKIQQMQTEQQQAADEATAEAQANQALIEQQKADTAEQLLEQEQAKQAAPLLMQQAQQQLEEQKTLLDIVKQHPELLTADDGGDDGTVPTDDGETPYDDGTGDTAMPGMETGGAEGEYDDGTPLPGADLMADADGEGFQE